MQYTKAAYVSEDPDNDKPEALMKLLERVGAVGPKTEQRVMALTGPQVDKARALPAHMHCMCLPQQCLQTCHDFCGFQTAHYVSGQASRPGEDVEALHGTLLLRNRWIICMCHQAGVYVPGTLLSMKSELKLVLGPISY